VVSQIECDSRPHLPKAHDSDGSGSCTLGDLNQRRFRCLVRVGSVGIQRHRACIPGLNNRVDELPHRSHFIGGDKERLVPTEPVEQ